MEVKVWVCNILFKEISVLKSGYRIEDFYNKEHSFKGKGVGDVRGTNTLKALFFCS